MSTISEDWQDEKLTYKHAFDLLSTNTQEYNNFIISLEKEVIPLLPSHTHFLDIGAGRGNLTKPISLCFQRSTIVEPNDHFFTEVMDWSQQRGMDLVGYNQPWQEVPLEEDTELVVISHVLYYIHPEDHLEFLNKAYALLVPGGKMVLALNGKQSDIWKLSQLLYAPDDFANLPYAERLFDNLQEWGFIATYRGFESHITTKTEAEMRFLIDFLMLDKVDFEDDSKAAIRDAYLQQHLRKPSDYSIASSGGIIVITKPLGTS